MRRLHEVNGDEFSGQVTVKVGPMRTSYRGTARFLEVDESEYRTRIEAKGRETRGSGTATATITAQLSEKDGATEAKVLTDLAITGRPAQFGRGVMVEVGDRLLAQFASCLATELGPQEAAPAAPDGAEGPATQAAHAEASGDSADLLKLAMGPVLKRAVPLLLGIAAVVAIVWAIARNA